MEVAVIVRRAFVDDLPSSPCVGGMRRRFIACRVVTTDASDDRRRRHALVATDASEDRRRRRMRHAFVDDSPSSRCVGGVVATDASDDRRRRRAPLRLPWHHSRGRRGRVGRGRVG